MLVMPSLTESEIALSISQLNAKYKDQIVESGHTLGIALDCRNILGEKYLLSLLDRSGRDMWFFRARRKTSFDDYKDILLPSQHTYLPAKLCTSMARCHISGHPVFYGSGSPHCAVEEMKTPSERNYILSIWRLPAQEVFTNNFLFGSNIRNGQLEEIKDDFLSAGYDQHELSDDLSQSQFRLLAEAWSDIFTGECYALSASIAHQLLYASTRNTILAYGSVVNGTDINYALPPHIADNLVLHKLIELEVDPATGQHRWLKACDAPDLNKWRPINLYDDIGYDPAMKGYFQKIS